MSQIELDNFIELFFNDVEQNIRDYRITVYTILKKTSFYLIGIMA